MSRATRGDADHCFVCGKDNPIGLRIRFTLDGEHCRGHFTSAPEHVGFDGVTHGGIVFAVLDDAMANWFFLQGARGYTAKSEIRYRNPMPVGATALADCTLVRRKGRLVMLSARLLDAAGAGDATVFAESEASFMLEDAGALADG
jgi:acyl-coenzyme A thioesterase PaaI-like protein